DGDDGSRNGAEYRAGSFAIAQCIAAETGDARDLVGEVGIVDLLELGAVVIEHHRVQHGGDVIGGQHRLVGNRRNLTASAQHRRRSGAQVEVGSLVADEYAQQRFH